MHFARPFSFLARRRRRGGAGSEIQPDMDTASLGPTWGRMRLQYGLRLCGLCYELAAHLFSFWSRVIRSVYSQDER